MNRIFLDLDGTLADFNVPNALKRFEIERGFFYKLKPLENLSIIDKLATQGNIYIVTSSPNIYADIDKMKWVVEHIPNIPYNNIVICRNRDNKAKIIKRKLHIDLDTNCYLLDDYTKNLIEWELAGGTGIKRLSKDSDNSSRKWKGRTLHQLCELDYLV